MKRRPIIRAPLRGASSVLLTPIDPASRVAVVPVLKALNTHRCLQPPSTSPPLPRQVGYPRGDRFALNKRKNLFQPIGYRQEPQNSHQQEKKGFNLLAQCLC